MKKIGLLAVLAGLGFCLSTFVFWTVWVMAVAGSALHDLGSEPLHAMAELLLVLGAMAAMYLAARLCLHIGQKAWNNLFLE